MAVPSRPSRRALVQRRAASRSFADIGCMWSVDGEIAFAAERAGATSVTGLDLMPPSERYLETHRSCGSRVRFVQGDLHDPAVLEDVGPHDVVWCSGLLYHAPHPLLTLERLRSITRETLLLATETLPLPGRLLTFAPSAWMHPARPGRLDRRAGYGNWFFLPTRGAARAMLLATGFEVVRVTGTPFHSTFEARPV